MSVGFKYQLLSSASVRVSTAAMTGAVALGMVALSGTVSAVASTPGVQAATPKPKADPAKARAKAKTANKAANKAANEAKAVSAAAADVVKLAEKQVGQREGGGGNTKFHSWYMSTPDARQTARRDGGQVKDYSGAAWCNMFVSWVGAQTGTKGMGRDAYTVAHAKWFKKTKRWGSQAKPGAVVFFAWEGGGVERIDHVGLVVKDNGNDTVTTVEGNTDNAVKERVRKKAQVAGYGYPEYRG